MTQNEFHERVNRAAQLLSVAIIIYTALRAADQSTVHMKDFEVFWSSARAWLSGLNPYLEADRRAVYPLMNDFQYLYPPHTLLLFSPIAMLPLKSAVWVYQGVKLAAVAAWAWGAREVYRVSWKPAAALLILLFGFNGSLLSDLTSGNISVFEQLGILLAGSGFLSANPLVFVIGLALGAQFKLVLGALGLLALLHPEPGFRKRAMAYGLVVFSGLALINAVFFRQYLGLYLGVRPDLTELGWKNAGFRSFWSSFYAKADKLFGVPWISLVLFGLTFALILKRSLAVLRARRADAFEVWLFGLLSYAVLVPRMKDYSWLLAVPCALTYLSRMPEAGRALLYFLIWVPYSWDRFPKNGLFSDLYENSAYLAALLLWGYESFKTLRSSE